MKLFVAMGNIDWFRVLAVIGAATMSWTTLASVIPPKYHRIGEALLTAATVFVTALVKPTKFTQREQGLTESQQAQAAKGEKL